MTLHLYVLYIETLNEKVLLDMSSLLSRKIQDKISKLRFFSDRCQKILAYYLLYKILAKELCKNTNEIIINIDRQGKPFLENSDRQFNLTYSNEVVALVTDSQPIGVDIEYITPLNDLDDLLEFFEENEKQQVLKENKRQRLEQFYKLWTLKESYLKAIGKGLSYSLKSFSINIYNGRASLSKSIDSENDWFFHQYDFNHKYKCAICAKHNLFPKNPIIIRTKELLDF